MTEPNTGATPPPPPPPPSQQPPPPPHSSGISAEERQWAMFAHLSSLLGLVTGGLGCFLGPLVIWLVKRETMPFVDDQGKEALNFNITVFGVSVILMIIGTILMVILIGFLFYLMVFAIGVFWLVITIIAAIKANEGVRYRYPFAIRLIK
ncbi:DUF4870 domain-containing protein [Luteimonas sp. MJ293]|uniref:DUF4870 domain-containing protein n=1 Tax=Luteimonas sp. MJ146 TaxID=3129240 RepID=UPI0031BA25F9